ncbi:hypothetical protein HXX76_016259 [Chlamydomonas incerta]|uniref:Protein kinase domain-containing protein n=1 Tax=Chlamydomonas incerta TaxID=51695 RepID=A0A835S7G1_CHLIN|nr:hypothetical protein HXX76_016259 [Chlamydomonas incerta]|eukprot:KAG2422137.1 hypothetical protein HXX76_016259 [Chlamydomonas incerta]
MEQEQRRYELNGGSQLQRQLEALPSPSDMADSNRAAATSAASSSSSGGGGGAQMIGYSGDPYFKGQRRYQLDLTNPQLAAAVEHTVLPRAVRGADHMVRVALVLRALKSGIGLLLDARGRLQQPTAAAVPAPAAPAPASASEYSDTAVPRVEVPLRDQALQRPYPLRPGSGYRTSRAVAVKFARMSADALRVHRAWAAAGLAPEVVSTRRLPCGLIMLVMELLAPEDGWVMFYSLPPRRQQQLHGAVVAALARAHAVVVDADRGLCGVHADMRQANVMVRLPPPREDADGGGGGGSGGSGSGAAGRGVAAGGEGGGGGVAAGGGAPGGSGRDAGGGGGAAGGGGGEDAAGGGSGGGSQPQQQQVAQQVRFVDLDWAGLVGHTRLPAFARMRLQGYGCGCAVTQEYDRALWNWEWVFGPM